MLCIEFIKLCVISQLLTLSQDKTDAGQRTRSTSSLPFSPDVFACYIPAQKAYSATMSREYRYPVYGNLCFFACHALVTYLGYGTPSGCPYTLRSLYTVLHRYRK